MSNRHFDSTCTSCGRRYLAKGGSACPYCSGVPKHGEEYTRKTFDSSDHDLKKGY